jgi:hypothetical protein
LELPLEQIVSKRRSIFDQLDDTFENLEIIGFAAGHEIMSLALAVDPHMGLVMSYQGAALVVGLDDEWEIPLSRCLR